MIYNGFTRSTYDNYVYHKRVLDDFVIYLLLYVDDILITTKCMSQIDILKKLLGDHFEMKDLGATRKILGMEIIRDKSVGKLSSLSDSILKKYCNIST